MTEKYYFGLDIFDLEDTIIKNKRKIVKREPPEERTTGPRRSHFNEKHKHEIFEQCELCNKWIKVPRESFTQEKDDNDDGKVHQYYYSSLMSAPDHSDRWVCNGCWDIIDVAFYGPYIVARPRNKPLPAGFSYEQKQESDLYEDKEIKKKTL